jgi:hypothetical protein
MATSRIQATEGDDSLKIASYTFSEDAVTKHIPRNTLVDSAGAEIDFSATGPVSAEGNSVYVGSTACTPISDPISCSSSGNNEIVAADATKRIRVLAWDLSPSAAVNAKWRTANTDITGLYYMGSIGNGNARNFNQAGWFETAVNEALNLNLSGATAVGGVVVYIKYVP